MRALMKQQWLTNRVGLLVWSVLLALTGVLTVAIFPGEDSALDFVRMFEDLPEALSAMVGDAAFTGTIDGWLQMNLYSMLLLIIAFYTISFVCEIVSREIDTRIMEFTLSLPIKRWKLIAVRFFMFALFSLMLIVIVFIALAITLIAYGHDVDLLKHFLVFVNVFVVNLALGGTVLLLSIFFTDYNRALTVGIGFVLASYILTLILQATGSESILRYLSFFYYMDSSSILLGRGLDIKNILVPTIASLCLVGVSSLVFKKKELYL
ncbi:MAG: ABC transporter permease subunit [Alkaliphilus sp.]